MKRFLACGGVNGSESALAWLRDVVAARRPDAVLFAGGVLPPERQYAVTTTVWGMTRADARFMERFFATLGELGVFTAVIPGPWDTPLEDFLRMGMHAEVEFSHLHLAHATLVEVDGLAVCGIGGCLVESGACCPDACTRTLAGYFLRPLRTTVRPRKVLLLPAPPQSLGGDRLCRIIDALIDSYPADLCVAVGPPHPTLSPGGRGQGEGGQPGVQHVAHTLVVNPGRLADGSAAWVDCGRRPQTVEFLNRQQQPPRVQVCEVDVDW